jgi:hypothetical protein
MQFLSATKTKLTTMKKIYALILFCGILPAALVAQVLPNPGFETWINTPASFPAPAYDDPTNWNDLNSTTAGLGQITCVKATAATEKHSGTAAVKLITKSVFGQTVNGIVTTGTINTTTQTIGGGLPYSGRPDSIIGFYKYTSVTGDNGFVELQLLGAGGDTDTVGYARFKTPSASVASFTRFATQITYRNTNPVVKAIWICSSSKDAVTHFVNSTMWVDDLAVVMPTSAGVMEQNKMEITVGPNPAVSFIQVKNPDSKKTLIKMYDVTGRILIEEQLATTAATIDISALPAGLYMYAICDESGKIIKTGKVIVQK